MMMPPLAAEDPMARATTLDSSPTLPDMDFALERAREFLGAACDPQLRLVSRRWRDALEAGPHTLLRVHLQKILRNTHTKILIY
jgi:hypothetical protein